MALEVDAGRGAARHDHADERDADRLAQRQPEAERQQRHDQEPAAQPEQRPERPGGARRRAGAARRHHHATQPAGAAIARRGSARLEAVRDEDVAGGAYGRSATWRARLSATASSRWWPAQVPVLRRGSILARSER